MKTLSDEIDMFDKAEYIVKAIPIGKIKQTMDKIKKENDECCHDILNLLKDIDPVILTKVTGKLIMLRDKIIDKHLGKDLK